MSLLMDALRRAEEEKRRASGARVEPGREAPGPGAPDIGTEPPLVPEPEGEGDRTVVLDELPQAAARRYDDGDETQVLEQEDLGAEPSASLSLKPLGDTTAGVAAPPDPDAPAGPKANLPGPDRRAEDADELADYDFELTLPTGIAEAKPEPAAASAADDPTVASRTTVASGLSDYFGGDGDTSTHDQLSREDEFTLESSHEFEKPLGETTQATAATVFAAGRSRGSAARSVVVPFVALVALCAVLVGAGYGYYVISGASAPLPPLPTAGRTPAPTPAPPPVTAPMLAPETVPEATVSPAAVEVAAVPETAVVASSSAREALASTSESANAAAPPPTPTVAEARPEPEASGSAAPNDPERTASASAEPPATPSAASVETPALSSSTNKAGSEAVNANVKAMPASEAAFTLDAEFVAPTPIAEPRSARVGRSEAAMNLARRDRSAELTAQLRSAFELLNRGRLAEADAAYSAVLAVLPTQRDALLGRAAIARRQGQLAEAYDRYAAVLARYPGDEVATAGLFELTGGQLAAADAARLKLLLDRAADPAPIHFALGRDHARAGRWPDAQQAFFEAFAGAPENADYAYNLAVSLDQLGKGAAARQYYATALRLRETYGARFDGDTVQDRIAQLDAAGSD